MSKPAANDGAIPRTPALRVRYIVALSLIALTTITTQALVQNHLSSQSQDASVINVAGHQRMLSQRLSLLAHRYVGATNPQEKAQVAETLSTTFQTWATSHDDLIATLEPAATSDLARQLHDNYAQLTLKIDRARSDIARVTDHASPTPADVHDLKDLAITTDSFLTLMHETVGLHEQAAQDKLASLHRIEIVLFIFTLTVLLIEALVVFEPAARTLQRQRRRLLDQADDLRETARLAERASEIKSAFLANTSHEIRTPLTSIIGSVELLKQPAHQADREELVHAISRNAEHLLELLNDVLDLSKIEAGHLQVERRPVQPAQLLQEVASTIRPLAARKQLDFHIEHTRTVHLDPTRTRQILLNLLTNAVKFTEQGSVTLRCSYHPDAKTPDALRFEAIDTGIGIPDTRLEHVFNAFEQVDASTTRKFGGTGLGLAVSRKLARLMGGDLVARSTLGQGSNFQVTLDPGKVSFEPPAETPAPTTQLDPQAIVGRVLIAEDNPDNQNLLRFFLKTTRVDATFVDNGRDALHAVIAQAYDGTPFDAVVMDMQMPVMDGPTATAAIRDAGHTLPILAFTANTNAEDVARFRDSGCTDFIAKPIKPDDFRKALQNALTPNHPTAHAA
ncbi:MAG: ATP-binding protein [Planctomycetota bacterium]